MEIVYSQFGQISHWEVLCGIFLFSSHHLKAAALIGKSEYGAFRNAIYICVPYLFSSCLSLLVITMLQMQTKDTLYICSAISGAVSISLLTIKNICEFIYMADFMLIWIIAFMLLLGLSFCTLVKFTKSQEELRWSLL